MPHDPPRIRFAQSIAATRGATDPCGRVPAFFKAPAEALCVIARWCVIDLVAAIVCLALMQSAFAHDPRHPEWTGWLMSQHNQNGAVCCDGNDTIVLGDNEWRANNNDYEVFYNGAWHGVPNWALTKSRDNITGTALVWFWRGHVQCFKPGTFY